MRIDSHCHTKEFSFDGIMTGEELLEGAIAHGLDAVVITDHYEQDYPFTLENPEIFSIEEYFTAIDGWQRIAGERLIIRKGIELGYQPHLAAEYSTLVRGHAFDSVLLSAHLFRGTDPYYTTDCFSDDKSESYTAYINELCEMVEKYSDFDILAHYDYLPRYAPYEDVYMYYENAPEAFDRLFRILIRKGKSLELNTRSMTGLKKRGASRLLPDKAIYLRYRELGGRYVTLNSDSHEPSTFGLYFEEAQDFLRECGFTNTTVFVGRKPVAVEI